MEESPLSVNKYGREEATTVPRAYLSALRRLAQSRLAESGGSWANFVFRKSYELIRRDDMERIEGDLLASGYRFTVSAVVSAVESPEKYKRLQGQDELEFLGTLKDGRILAGYGDNVMKREQNVLGSALYVHTTQDVLELMTLGVPPQTIAIVDDSGGTLTAPILADFAAIICMGGTVRSHLGILSREHDIPCFMNSSVAGVKNGDRLELNVSAPAKTAGDYQQRLEKKAEIWKVIDAE
jgi:hypothetical protein